MLKHSSEKLNFISNFFARSSKPETFLPENSSNRKTGKLVDFSSRGISCSEFLLCKENLFVGNYFDGTDMELSNFFLIIEIFARKFTIDNEYKFGGFWP
jgi:hypothetical protein